ncbi:hypothetical protein AVEN_8661-1 [Araneus ventricosus]|uniref:Uncharacterized protein n=1 Tax=Araneus ventricosus TaxID=182803 RepID=A0A4Y2C2T0_ARAVE|nr:hypothetical protein AVEN_8661-1 [Araneus ventricosus]
MYLFPYCGFYAYTDLAPSYEILPLKTIRYKTQPNCEELHTTSGNPNASHLILHSELLVYKKQKCFQL